MPGEVDMKLKQGVVKQTTNTAEKDLCRQRANLRHLVYSMEHDRSLNAQGQKIDCLRALLQGIERRMGGLR